VLSTLAFVAARAGAVAEARAAIDDALLRPPRGLLPLDDDAVWLVVGATAETLGLPQEAIKAYRRIPEDRIARGSRFSTHALAHERLAALTGARAGK
jgi:hypothetical protein